MTTAAITVPVEPTGPVASAENAPQEAVPARPDWLPEEFESPEALAAAYQEALTKTKQPEDSLQEQQPPQEQTAAPTSDEAVGKFVTDAGFDPAQLSREIATKGDINPDAKAAFSAKLKEAGLPETMIDEYITGQKAVMDASVRDIMTVAGGEQGWQEMAQWISTNLSDAELQAFNQIMTTADVNTAKLTVGNMYARYRSATPGSGKRVRGGTGMSTHADVFHSWEQLKTVQADPRYENDPAFRKEVEAKIDRTLRSGGLFS